MKEDLQIALSRMASRELQVRYCVNGTADEYLLPDELLDSALNTATLSIKGDQFTAAEKQQIEKFILVAKGAVDGIPFDSESAADLILRDDEWNRVRESAMECLTNLGFEMKVEI